MIRSTLRKAGTALAVAALGAMALPAGAASTLDLEIDDAKVRNGVIEVEIDADVASEPIVFEDAVGDGLGPGTDIASVEFELVDDRNATFRINLADPLPSVGATSAVMFFWEMQAGASEVQLSAMHNRFSTPGAWSFQLETCSPDPDTGTNTCTGVDIPGSYADGVIEMEAGLSALGVKLGDTIFQAGDGVYATYGAAGLIWNGVGFFDDVPFAPIAIPSLDVTVTNDTTGESVTESLARGRAEVDIPGSAGDAVTATATFDGATATATATAR